VGRSRLSTECDTLLFGREFTVYVRLIANVDGNAIAASVARSSGVPAVDSAALDVASAYRFAPGDVEGAPLAMWVQAPLTFRFPPETEAARRRRLRRQATSPSPPN
jgi:TonB family protein